MKFQSPLIKGTLIKRYKRFMADVNLEDGTTVTAHCANSGSMLGVGEPGAEVWLSPAGNPDRKLKFTWELIKVGTTLVGINTARPNAIAEEGIKAELVAELNGYGTLRREVKYGRNSRIDILLEDDSRPPCYVEVKSVTLSRNGLAEFPDAVTSRGTKHLEELSNMVGEGSRSVMLYLVQREDCRHFQTAADIDPTYDTALRGALAAGVEALCYACHVNTTEISLGKPLSIKL